MSSQLYMKLKKAHLSKTISDLQYKVYTQLLSIPAGKVATYNQIAKAVKCNSPRAIGQALKKNPYAPEVPCHRVIKSNLTLGGFSGSIENKTVEKKLKLLKSEGVQFQPAKEDTMNLIKVDPSSIWKSSDRLKNTINSH
jgi:methylated-DNA-[protein]-cysteine S-methyltransferase